MKKPNPTTNQVFTFLLSSLIFAQKFFFFETIDICALEIHKNEDNDDTIVGCDFS